MLIEVIVYMGVLLILLGLGYAALYDSMDHSAALRRSANDIVHALHAGERWRADVRAASAIQVETNAEGRMLHLHGPKGEVDYLFATNAVFRRLERNTWHPVLKHVKATAFVSESRLNVSAWRWELELQSNTRKFAHVQPLFTFIAVPVAESRK